MKVIYEKSICQLIADASYEADRIDKKIKEIQLTKEEFNDLGNKLHGFVFTNTVSTGCLRYCGIACVLREGKFI